MTIEIVTCRACGTRNASSRTVCLRCGEKLGSTVIWASQSELRESFRERQKSPPDIHPERIYKALTFFVRIFTFAVAMSAGGWLTGFLVPPDRLTQYDYYLARQHVDFYRRFLDLNGGPKKVLGTDSPEFLREWMNDRYLESLAESMWKTRDKVQSTLATLFWTSLVLLALFYWIRKEPYIFDVTVSQLPKVISRRIPYFIARWRVSVLDENSNELTKEFYRTGSQAKQKAERLAQETEKIRIVWDGSAYESYNQFIGKKDRMTVEKLGG